MTRNLITACCLGLVLGITGCGGLETTQAPEEVPEIYPGILMGYLPMDNGRPTRGSYQPGYVEFHPDVFAAKEYAESVRTNNGDRRRANDAERDQLRTKLESMRSNATAGI